MNGPTHSFSGIFTTTVITYKSCSSEETCYFLGAVFTQGPETGRKLCCWGIKSLMCCRALVTTISIVYLAVCAVG